MGYHKPGISSITGVLANAAMAVPALRANSRAGANLAMLLSKEALKTAFVAPEISRQMKRLDQYKARLKDKGISKEERDLLREECTDISAFVLQQAPLAMVTPDADPRILQQLFENEQVHKLADPSDILNRIGGIQDDKQCYALIVPTGEGPRVLASVFVHFTSLPIAHGRIDYSALPSDVQNLREKPKGVIAADGAPAAVFWTISYNDKIRLPGAGQELIRRVYAELSPDVLKTTLSPCRGFTGVGTDHPKDMAAELTKNADVLRDDVLAYLLEKDDMVLGFHGGNGAYIANININPDDPQDWITINYLYPSDPKVLAENRASFKDGRVPMSIPLYKSLSPQDRWQAEPVTTDFQVPVWAAPAL